MKSINTINLRVECPVCRLRRSLSELEKSDVHGLGKYQAYQYCSAGCESRATKLRDGSEAIAGADAYLEIERNLIKNVYKEFKTRGISEEETKKEVMAALNIKESKYDEITRELRRGIR